MISIPCNQAHSSTAGISVPISPDQIRVTQKNTPNTPNAAFDIINFLLMKYYNGERAVIMISSIEELALKEDSLKPLNLNHFLCESFQNQYREHGWTINNYTPLYRRMDNWFIEFIKT